MAACGGSRCKGPVVSGGLVGVSLKEKQVPCVQKEGGWQRLVLWLHWGFGLYLKTSEAITYLKKDMTGFD